jgi:hypothetical protein
VTIERAPSTATSGSQRHQDVLDVVDRYFKGLYTGDVALLRTIFHPQAVLFGEVKGQPYLKPIAEYLEIVASRASPRDLGEPFQMEVLAVEVLDTVAYARVHSPMLGGNYFDYLALVRQDDRWLIVNKLFTHVA